MALNNVPLATQRIKDTQAPILINFQTIDTAFSVNHVGYNDSSGRQGAHKFLSMPQITPAPAYVVGDFLIFNKATAAPFKLPAGAYLWMKKSNVANSEIPWTATATGTGGTPSHPFGWTYLPSGILVKWGNIAGTNVTSPMTVTFPTGATIPDFKTIQIVMLSTTTTNLSNPDDANKALFQLFSFNTTQFRTTNDIAPNTDTGLIYLAIGT